MVVRRRRREEEQQVTFLSRPTTESSLIDIEKKLAGHLRERLPSPSRSNKETISAVNH